MEVSDQELGMFISALRQASDYDFSEYSDKSLRRRIAKILVDHKMSLPQLLHAIEQDEGFAEKIVREVTVNTTELFRDPQVWHMLRYKVLPLYAHLLVINIWDIGCSTGQEVYSLLILLNELGLFEKTNVYATDLNSEVLSAASKGVYRYRFNISYLDNFDKVIRENPYNTAIHYDVPYEKYFEIDNNRDLIRMKPFLTSKPVFRKHDLVQQGNIWSRKFDLIFCRNVIIYFNFNLQNKVFKTFHGSLHESGCLVLGLHESILGPFSSHFEKKDMVYFIKNPLP
ncbi:MAG TPA: CheR family methyltransferase [Bacteroidales bacterium]|nr:CheR family methyltransferase [Bacteroidales bacterium]